MSVPTISVVIPHYNSSDLLRGTTGSISASAVSEGIPIEIVIVDDGSSDEHRERAQELSSTGIEVVSCTNNVGRSGALNIGLARATSDLVLILDCDCRPGSDDFFRGHLETISTSDVSMGGLLSISGDFWGRYQTLTMDRRLAKFKAGDIYSFTTANILLRKCIFRAVGGFDQAYRRYGFEDRDLLIRLVGAGAKLSYSSRSPAVHADTKISLKSIAVKLHEAGSHSSRLFSAKHPEIYRSLGYSRLDARLHPMLRPVGRHAGTAASWLANKFDPWLDQAPFPLGAAVTRAVTALAYLGGTSMVEP